MHPVNQISREVQKLRRQNGHTIYACLQQQFITWRHSSRSSGGSMDENMTTLWKIWTWIWLLGAFFWIVLFEQQFILGNTMTNVHYVKNHLWNSVGLFPWNWKTDQWTKRNHWCKHCSCPRCYVDVDKLIVWKGFPDHQRQSLRLLSNLCSVWENWEVISIATC